MAGVMVRNVCRLLTLVDICCRGRFLSNIRIPHLSLYSHAHKAIMADPQPPAADPGRYTPLPAVRGMTDLDRKAFTQTINVPAIRIPTRVLNKVVKSLKKVVMQRPRLKPIVDDHQNQTDTDGKEHRLLLLDPQSVSSAESFSEDQASALRAYSVKPELQQYELKLTYDNLKTDEILRAVLPEGQDVTSSFSRVGHIAHMNLREHQLPFKNLIGQVIMDKNPGVTCVVNKTNIIDSTYRNFQMEVMAGETNMVAKVRENGVLYEFDFARVYWNPRLSTEHERIISLLHRDDTVLDVFAGVGPFSIPAARRGCTVFANDLNPESYRWLQHNTKLNKVGAKVTTFNLDGREFIRGPVREQLSKLMKGSAGIHVIMNLPALALEFLDAFRDLLGQEQDQDQEPSCEVTLPQVHCYGFSKEDDCQKDVVERAEAALGVSLQGRCTVHMVRNVAPNKEMMCVSFTMPAEVLYSSTGKDCSEPPTKRQKCEETE